ncbi:uncharacterized protein V1516DRAFT_676991 [Lipomyces oligophaga]|uniref:uncharacterized protein n=1 Tax=Lipomyces oligophaga TaxID=45792 RepID=UPI0034CD6E06
MNAQNLEVLLMSIREELQEVASQTGATVSGPASGSRARNLSPATRTIGSDDPRRESIAAMQTRLELAAAHMRPQSRLRMSMLKEVTPSELTEGDNLEERLREVEAQRTALQESLHSLRTRYQSETQRNAQSLEVMRRQVLETRNLFKAMVPKPNDLLLPQLGSGTTGVASPELARQQAEVIRARLSAAEREKTELENSLVDMKQQLLRIRMAAAKQLQVDDNENRNSVISTRSVVDLSGDDIESVFERLRLRVIDRSAQASKLQQIVSKLETDHSQACAEKSRLQANVSELEAKLQKADTSSRIELQTRARLAKELSEQAGWLAKFAVDMERGATIVGN